MVRGACAPASSTRAAAHTDAIEDTLKSLEKHRIVVSFTVKLHGFALRCSQGSDDAGSSTSAAAHDYVIKDTSDRR